MMNKEEVLNIDIGDTLKWTPDLESKDLEGFKHSSQFSVFRDKDVISFEITVVENRHGFKNSFSFEMRAIKSDGSYLNDFEFLHDEDQQKELLSTPEDREFVKPYQERPWVEVDESTEWLGYLLSKGAKYFEII